MKRRTYAKDSGNYQETGESLLSKVANGFEMVLPNFLTVPEDVIYVIISKFIQKAYCNILSCVCKSFYTTISKLVSKLDLRLYREITPNAIEGSLKRYKNLTDLYLDNMNMKIVKASFSKTIFDLNLRVLSVAHTNMSINFLSKISQSLPQLEKLNLSGNKTNIKILWELSKLSRLNYLDISNSHQLSESNELELCLSQFTQLRELSLAHISLPNMNITTLSCLQNLRSLDISNTYMKVKLSAFSSLLSLTLLNSFLAPPQPIELPPNLIVLDVDIKTFLLAPDGTMETLCVRKLNDLDDDILPMTTRSHVKFLEMRQFKIEANLLMNGVNYLLKKTPLIEVCFFFSISCFIFFKSFLGFIIRSSLEYFSRDYF